jgi:hypothetical protein
MGTLRDDPTPWSPTANIPHALSPGSRDPALPDYLGRYSCAIDALHEKQQLSTALQDVATMEPGVAGTNMYRHLATNANWIANATRNSPKKSEAGTQRYDNGYLHESRSFWIEAQSGHHTPRSYW